MMGEIALWAWSPRSNDKSGYATVYVSVRDASSEHDEEKFVLCVLVLIYETAFSGSHVMKIMEVYFIETVPITLRKMKRSRTIDTEY